MKYDLIVVGSGNGACGFLSSYLKANPDPALRLLVLEEGKDFFYTSDIASQLNWLRSFAEGQIFKLHNALTPNNIPIISGRANTMGGGGSINYTMIHESSEWLATHLGHTPEYWTALKEALNPRFERPNPADATSAITNHILDIAQQAGFTVSYDAIANIPNQPNGDAKSLHLFPTLFNSFGQRTHSGVSLVNWADPRLTLKTQYRVEQIEFAPSPDGSSQCLAVQARALKTGQLERFALSAQGKLILCAGAATPRLLLPHQELLQNNEIGKGVSDHILLPLGLYIVDRSTDISPKDNYIPLFATVMWQPSPEVKGRPTLCTFDFFAGELDRLIFLISHLFLALLLPNWLKRYVIRFPLWFTITKNLVRFFIQAVNFIIDLIWGIIDLINRKPLHQEVRLVTAILKFQPAVAGHYVADSSRITLDFFAEIEAEDGKTQFNQDKAVAKTVLKEHIKLLNQLGHRPHWLVRCLLRWLTRIPYEADQVDDYVEAYSQNFLLTEQHLAGGCLLGSALERGEKNAKETGKVRGTTNVHVADLSAVPLPRVSPQMTAYLIGFHVAQQLCCALHDR